MNGNENIEESRDKNEQKNIIITLHLSHLFIMINWLWCSVLYVYVFGYVIDKVFSRDSHNILFLYFPDRWRSAPDLFFFKRVPTCMLSIFFSYSLESHFFRQNHQIFEFPTRFTIIGIFSSLRMWFITKFKSTQRFCDCVSPFRNVLKLIRSVQHFSSHFSFVFQILLIYEIRRYV